MKKLFVLLCCITAGHLNAQLHVGATENLQVGTGTIFSFDGLTFTPSANFILSNTTLTRSTTPVPARSGRESIGRAYYFSNPVSFSGELIFTYLLADLNAHTEPLLVLQSRNAGAWSASGNGSVLPVEQRLISSYDNAIFDALTLVESSSMLLPLKLVSLTATSAGGQAILQWNTENEVGSSHFLVERSADGHNFSAIGRVAAGRNSYRYTDPSPLPLLNHYRLQIVDKDGKFTYSKVVGLKFNSGAKLELFPNPATDIIHVRYQSAGKTLRIFDSRGRVVKTINSPLSGEVSMAIDISALSRGLYFVRNGDAIGQFIKN